MERSDWEGILEENDCYGTVVVTDEELEAKISDMTKAELNFVADTIADGMRDTYRKVVRKELEKFQRKKDG